MEVSSPTSLWGQELMTMTLWSGELPKAVLGHLCVLAQILVPEPSENCLSIWSVGLEVSRSLKKNPGLEGSGTES